MCHIITCGVHAPLQGMSGTIALVGTLAYVLCFAFGVGPVPGVLVSEINPGNIRGVHTCPPARPPLACMGVS